MKESRDNTVGIATDYGLDGQVDRVRVEARFLSSDRLDQFWYLPSPHFQCVLEVSFTQRVKWPGCEADHSPTTSAEMKNSWIHTSTPPIHLDGIVLN
jgi:hypothetical protein